jgi:photosystem I reaction center subunit XII
MRFSATKLQSHFDFMPIADSQVFIALFVALATGIFAVRLGVALYK